LIKFPDYDNSILNLINSIEKYFGLENGHPTLEIVDTILENKYRNVVVMVFDAMGSRNLQDILSDDCFLRTHLLKEISSVFPPTTTAATTTLESGLAPSEHAWLGWSLHFPEVSDNVNIFINTNDDDQTVADYHVAGRYLPFKSVVAKINEVCDARAESISRFGSYHTESFEEIIESVETLCREDGRHYLYTYWNEPDTSMHSKGVTSDEAIAWVKRINSEIEELSTKLQDTVLFIIADHGHIDGKNKYIGDYPDIVDTLKWLPSIEPRALAFHVKEGREQEFHDAFLEHFKNDFMLLSSQEVLKMNLFGNGKTHPRFEEFLGNYLAVAISNVSIFNSIEKAEKFVGVHAGLTEIEMMVPLIVVERK
jgi:predicted AlkP superfamily pyrophosphatase or phosphodiesterase